MIIKCAECEKELHPDIHSGTSCYECKKDFCFGMWSSCFSDYHLKNKLHGHSALSITDPTWEINLKVKK